MASVAPSRQSRIVSMDQFRGYTVAGMFVVNFLGGLAAIHPVFKHHNTYFSYADSIMPSFMFACGFSYRLTILKRLANPAASAWDIYGKIFKRSLGLALVSMMALGMGEHFRHAENAMRRVEIMDREAAITQALARIDMRAEIDLSRL